MTRLFCRACRRFVAHQGGTFVAAHFNGRGRRPCGGSRRPGVEVELPEPLDTLPPGVLNLLVAVAERRDPLAGCDAKARNARLALLEMLRWRGLLDEAGQLTGAGRYAALRLRELTP